MDYHTEKKTFSDGYKREKEKNFGWIVLKVSNRMITFLLAEHVNLLSMCPNVFRRGDECAVATLPHEYHLYMLQLL